MNEPISIQQLEKLVDFANENDCYITKHRVEWPSREELQSLVDKTGKHLEIKPQITELNFVDLVLSIGKVTLFKTLAECHESFDLKPTITISYDENKANSIPVNIDTAPVPTYGESNGNV